MSYDLATSPLLAVVQQLDKHPALMAEAFVFGSAQTRLEGVGDLDVGIRIHKPYAFGDLDRYRPLLRAGAMGTPRYGLFDLFLIFDNAVWVRDDRCLGFVRAKQAKLFREAVANGTPWTTWRERLNGPPIPTPNKRATVL